MNARLTVALPVFNGGSLLAEALECVLREPADAQPLLRAVVYDNASNDDSVAIARRFAAKDRRLEVVVREQNIGAIANFADAAAAATTPYFAWRAYDDISSPGYFGQLIEALEAAPQAVLAAPNCVNVKLSSGQRRWRPAPVGLLGPPDTIARADSSWLYGVWRTKVAQAASAWVRARGPALWGWDHLALLYAALQGPFVGCESAEFSQRLNTYAEKANGGHSHGARNDARRAFWEAGRELVLEDSRANGISADEIQRRLDALEVLIERRVLRRPIRGFRDISVKFRARFA